MLVVSIVAWGAVLVPGCGNAGGSRSTPPGFEVACPAAEAGNAVEHYVTYVEDWMQVGFNATSSQIRDGAAQAESLHARSTAGARAAHMEALARLRGCFANDLELLGYLQAYETAVDRLLNREPADMAALMATHGAASDASGSAQDRMFVLLGLG